LVSANRRAASAKFVAIAVGGVVGAALRWALLRAFPVGHGLPWTVLLINVAGSGVLGVVLAEEWRHPRMRVALHDAAGIGFCGGLTTFSTFAVEVATFLRDGRPTLAGAYAALSVGGSLVAVVLGAAALRRVRAIGLPLEAAP
jgi:CrcB protein